MTEEERIKIDTARKMNRLLENSDFSDVILKMFLSEDIIGTVMSQNLNSEATIDALKARQELSKFISDIITEGEILLNENFEG
jgi:hypothetical protein